MGNVLDARHRDGATCYVATVTRSRQRHLPKRRADSTRSADSGDADASIRHMNIGFPFAVDSTGRSAVATDDDHIRQMIEQLLFTSPGERVNRPDFGSDLRRMLFAPNSPELAAALQFAVQSALQRYLADVIDVQALEVSAEESTLHV